MFRKIRGWLPLSIGLLVGLFLLFGLSQPAIAANPTTINFQGKVVNNTTGNVGTNVTPDGNFTVVFRLYDNSSPTIGANCNSNSQCWWEETDTVSVNSGVFQVELGAGCALTSACNSTHSGIDFNSNNSLYLTMKFNGDSSGTNNGFMTPVMHLTTVPYAFNSDKVGGLTASQLARTDVSDTFSAALTVTAANALTLGSTSNAGTILFQDGTVNNRAVTLTTPGLTNSYSLSWATSGATGNQCLQSTSGSTSTVSALQWGSCGGTNTLQSDYNATSGNTITTTTARDLSVTLANTATASNFLVNVASGSTSRFAIQYNGADTFSITNAASAQGSALFKNAANNSTAFQVQNSGSANLLQVDTAGNNVNLLGNHSGELQTWQTNTNNLSSAQRDNGAIAANGYLYSVGGSGVVDYAKLNVDGSTGVWTATTSLPGSLGDAGIVAANGYIYAVGGYSGGPASTVYYSKINSDGTLGSWLTTTSLLATLSDPSVVTANGYMYVAGGWNGTAGQQATYYAKLNADGTIGSWTNSGNNLPVGVFAAGTGAANGYMYIVGGANAAGTAAVGTVYYAQFNATTGSIGSWTTSANPLPSVNRTYPTVAIANGFIYAIGGNTTGGSGIPGTQTVYYASLATNGSNSTWTSEVNQLPDSREEQATTVANGYVYVLGGINSSSAVSNVVYYASVPRLKVAGALDLVGSDGGTLVDGQTGSGGNLTAGNTNIVGTLDVQSQALFAQGVAVGGNLNISGTTLFKNAANSNTAFQVQNANGADILNLGTIDTNLITNPGFEVNTSNWSAAGTTAPTRDTSNKYLGFGSGSVVGVTAAGEGFKQVLATTLSNGTYTISWYDKLVSGPAFTDVMAAYSATGGAPVNCTGINTQTVSSSGWTRHWCQISVSGASASNYITIFQVGSSTARTWNIDAVQLESGSIATGYGAGTLLVNANITSPVNLKNTENSTTAFQVQNSSGVNLLTVDTLNSNVILGTAGSGGLTGSLVFNNSTNTNTVTLKAAATTTSYSWTLPTADSSGCLQSNGSGALSITYCGGTHVNNYPTDGTTYTKAADALLVIVEAIGGGGGGGGGGSIASGTAASTGGAGGGGGEYATKTFTAPDVGSSVTVTAGSAGTAGTGGSNAAGVNGGVGGNSTFGTLLTAYGGGGGQKGQNSATLAGGGGGAGFTAAGTTSGASGTGGTGGGLGGSAAGVNNTAFDGAGGGTNATGGNSYWGGAGGGGSSAGGTTSKAGGSSARGGAGGGGAGSCAVTTCTATAGGAGGTVPGSAAGGGGNGGSVATCASTGNGSSGTTPTGFYGGTGGGGGASIATAGGTGCAGGAGGTPGGAGGGGGAVPFSSSGTGGAGGAGGQGGLRVTTLRGQGADLAEIYCTNDEQLKAGDTVAIDPSLKAGVMKTQSAYDKNAVGIISTNPGLVTGDVEEQCVKPVLVALSGRVPVQVSTENGPIKPGDYLTPSSTPGVAMKATKAGIIIGQALTGYDGSTGADYVVAFIKNGQYNGSSITDVLAQAPNTDPSQSVEQQALQYLMGWKDQALDTTNLSEITADRVTAGMEVITPSVVADKVAANTITPSSTGNVTVDLGQNGNLFIKNNGGQSFSIDSTGNAQFGLNLSVLGNLEAKGGLTVDGDSLFGGNATFAKMAQFLGDTNFNGDVNVKGRLTFNSDTGGIAIIKKGATRVDITFAKEYGQQPIISASLVSDQVRLSDGTIEPIQAKEQRLFDAGYNYLISNVTTKGFTIVLNKSATEDIQFNWYAIAVSNANTFTSDQTQAPALNSISSSNTQSTDNSASSQTTSSGP